MIRPETSRRSFLKAAAPFALSLGPIARGQIPIGGDRFTEDDIPAAREQLLKQVNAERGRAGLSQLQLDELACKVGNEHARDMVQQGFLSHWGSDGLKPYHRYSFAGGTDAVQENLSSADRIQSVTREAVATYLHDMHQSMIDEVPPLDGHRQSILFPAHTHVGFGIALLDQSIRVAELYLGRYVSIDPLPHEMPTGTSVVLKGKMLYPIHFLNCVQTYYEPPASPPEIGWLRQPRSYAMPDVISKLLPLLPEHVHYVDGTRGSIDIQSKQRFRVRAPLSKTPGINTLMVWIDTGREAVAFPAAQICIRVV